MFDKNLVINSAKNKFSGELLDIVLKQIDVYFELVDSNFGYINNYKIGDDVYLNSNHLLHGIGKHVDLLELFSNRGIVSQDFFGDDSNHAFCYTSAFWNVKGDISLREFIKNYSGIVAKVKDKYVQVPYGGLDEFVFKMKDVDHWLWTAESSMEIRFMPSLARDINQVGFIINMESELAKKLRENSVFKDNFNRDYAFEFVSEKARNKFLEEGFVADFFQRADYLIFGVPKCCIEGIIVGREVENNIQYLAAIKNLFKSSYICNLDGKVIY